MTCTGGVSEASPDPETPSCGVLVEGAAGRGRGLGRGFGRVDIAVFSKACNRGKVRRLGVEVHARDVSLNWTQSPHR